VLARRRTELLVAIWGAITFAAVLASYFAFRPVRDALVLDGNPDQLPVVFTASFVAMSIVSPAWSALLARGGRRRYVPLAFHAFAVSWIGFSLLVSSGLAPVAIGRVFYVWSAVFNFFVVSVFWSLLADLLGPDVARRLYGPISAGGTAGALLGPLLTRQLVGTLGVHGVLVLSAALLELGAAGLYALRRAGEALPGVDARDDEPPEPALPAAARGLVRLRSPDLMVIAGYVFCTAAAATFVYLEQAPLAKALLTTRKARTELFATIDLWTNLGVFVAQTLLAAPLLARLGPGVVLLVLPLASGVGIPALISAPSLGGLMGALIATRIATHGFTRPARELLFTVVPRDDKYRAKNAIDTVIYRFGDFATAWLHAGLAWIGGAAAIVTAAMVIVSGWIALAAAIGIRFRRRLSPATKEPA
jgi:AAA family ATP:ADP antiporter